MHVFHILSSLMRASKDLISFILLYFHVIHIILFNFDFNLFHTNIIYFILFHMIFLNNDVSYWFLSSLEFLLLSMYLYFSFFASFFLCFEKNRCTQQGILSRYLIVFCFIIFEFLYCRACFIFQFLFFYFSIFVFLFFNFCIFVFSFYNIFVLFFCLIMKMSLRSHSYRHLYVSTCFP